MAGHDLIDDLVLLLTNSCNLRCDYCFQSGSRDSHTPWRHLQAALDWALDHSPDELGIRLSGGEPLLARDHVLRVVEYVDRNRPADLAVEYTLLTNGLLLDRELFVMLADRGTKFRISIDGVSAAQQRRGRHTPAALDEVLVELRAAAPRAFAEQVRAVMTITPENLPYLAAGVDHLLARGFRDIVMGPVLTPCPGWDEPHLDVAREQLGRVSELCRSELERSGEVPVTFLKRHEFEPARSVENEPICAAAESRMATVDVDGRMYSCGLFAGSVRMGGEDTTRQSEAVCWGRPGEPGFDARRGGHEDRLIDLPLFQRQPKRTGLFGECVACEHATSCTVCPSVFLAGQADTEDQRVPGFVCSVHAAMSEARRAFPPLPLPPEMEIHPAVMAQRQKAFEAEMAELLGRS